VVDDDERLRELLQHYLSENHFFVSGARDAAQARQKLQTFIFDAMVLDVMMPGETGVELMASLGNASPPTLMLTAMGESQDRIRGLETGASDYLVKPFEPRELVLRLHNILRRTKEDAKDTRMLRFGEFSIDIQTGKLFHGNDPIYLTSAESLCLKILAEHAGKPLTRERLAELTATGGAKSNERSVDVLINRLRKKIEPKPGRPIYIQTVRGSGYVLHLGR